MWFLGGVGGGEDGGGVWLRGGVGQQKRYWTMGRDGVACCLQAKKRRRSNMFNKSISRFIIF